ncbi:uncharacterized protein [Zea mays]|uniref:uncharacterized protein isoform X1 n=1 Tax=Zea mays TaxID=4577 RepID=UPI0009AA7DBF|nr:uncharacterized protein LOC103630488 isoform X1 [Zea mays]|eukprot:XP_020395180.1 uncharacterized protein LOC103630488 isoform X1 [Zea mays]
MGTCGLAAVVALLLASALLPGPDSASARSLLEGENPSSGERRLFGSPQDAPAPAVSGQSSAAGQQTENKRHQESLPPVTSPPPPPPTQETNSQKAASPPPGPNVGTGQEDTGSQGRREETDKLKEAMEKCDASHKCSSGNEFSACLQVPDNALVGPYIIVHNEGQHDMDIDVKEPSSNTNNDKKPLHLVKGAFGQMNITYTASDGGNVTLSDGKNVDCIIHVGGTVERQSVSDLQKQFQQVAAYAMHLNPIYGASFFVFAVVLVSVVCVCCKFAKRRGNDGLPYQQLEMGGQAPNSSGVDITATTTDGWEHDWDDDWDDEAAAGPVDKKPTSSVSANGLPLRSQTNSKDGWNVDWDD